MLESHINGQTSMANMDTIFQSPHRIVRLKTDLRASSKFTCLTTVPDVEVKIRSNPYITKTRSLTCDDSPISILRESEP